jgi:hypothetical protein
VNKGPGRDADIPFLSSAETKNEWRDFSNTVHVFMTWCRTNILFMCHHYFYVQQEWSSDTAGCADRGGFTAKHVNLLKQRNLEFKDTTAGPK